MKLRALPFYQKKGLDFTEEKDETCGVMEAFPHELGARGLSTAAASLPLVPWFVHGVKPIPGLGWPGLTGRRLRSHAIPLMLAC
jgi:hypothetical protein